MIDPLASRVLFGLLFASGLAMAAHRARALTSDGAIAAAMVGAATVIGGWDWVIFLLFFFVTSSALSRWNADVKHALVSSTVEKGDRRDAIQVAANGAVFAIAALGSVLAPASGWLALGAGAVATATADTWGTEIGLSWGGIPRQILTGAELSPGASGGVTLVGTAGTILGAGAAAIVAWTLRWQVPAAAVFAGGVAGAFLDSLLGATVQERRWCATCGKMTERRVHTCGASTERSGGIPGFGNDAVNLTSIVAGAVVTRMLS